MPPVMRVISFSGRNVLVCMTSSSGCSPAECWAGAKNLVPATIRVTSTSMSQERGSSVMSLMFRQPFGRIALSVGNLDFAHSSGHLSKFGAPLIFERWPVPMSAFSAQLLQTFSNALCLKRNGVAPWPSSSWDEKNAERTEFID